MAKRAVAASSSPPTSSSKGKGPAATAAAAVGLEATDSEDPAGTTVEGAGGYGLTTGLPEIRVNKWALGELKTACDDAVKQLLSQPSPSAFRANNVHLDVRLALGWSASLIAFAAAYHAYRHPSFQQTRPYVLAGVVSFVLLGAAMNAYARWVEGNIIYQGKRKLFAAGRIETQSLTVSTSCEAHVPIYHLAVSYTHSTNGGKSLLKQFDRDVTKPFGELFDEEGRLARSELERMLIGVLEEAQSVGR